MTTVAEETREEVISSVERDNYGKARESSFPDEVSFLTDYSHSCK